MRKFQQNSTHFLTYQEVRVSTTYISDIEIELLKAALPEGSQMLLAKMKSALGIMRHSEPRNFKIYGLDKKSSSSNYGFYHDSLQIIKKNDIKNISDGVMYNKVSFTKLTKIKEAITSAQAVAQHLQNTNLSVQIFNHTIKLSQVVDEFKKFVKSLEDDLLYAYQDSFEVNPKDYKNEYIKLDFDRVINMNKAFYALVKYGDDEGFIGVNRNLKQGDTCWHAIVRDIRNAMVFHSLEDAERMGYGPVATIELDVSFNRLEANNLPFVAEAAIKMDKAQLEKNIEAGPARKKSLKV